MCSKEFTLKKNLLRHESVHERLNHMCEMCGACYKRPDHFRSHQEKCGADGATVGAYPTQVDTQELRSKNEESSSDSSGKDNCEKISEVITLNENSDEENGQLVETDKSSFQHPSSHSVNTDDYNADIPMLISDDDDEEEEDSDDDDTDAEEEEEDNEDDAYDNNDFSAGLHVNDVHDGGIFHNDTRTSNESSSECPLYVSADVITKSPAGKHRNTLGKKQARLSSVLEKIVTTNISRKDQAKILRRSLCSSFDKKVLETAMMVDIEDDSVHEAKLITGVLEYLKGLNCKFASSRTQFCDLLLHVCDQNVLNDEMFLSWLAKRLEKRPHRLLAMVNNHLSKTGETRGRKAMPLEVKQAVFDAWHDNSIVTVDRRDGRDQVNLREMVYFDKYRDLKAPDDIELEFFKNKRNQRMVRSTRRIATKTVREIKKKIEHNVSIGFIINLKPFYVQNPTEREKASCLCKACLNLRIRFNELKKHMKDKTVDSMTQYYSHSCTCAKSENGFLKLQCLTSTCDNCNIKQAMPTNDDFIIPKQPIKVPPICFGEI